MGNIALLLYNRSGDLLRLSEPSEYCLFMCDLILLSAQRLRAAGVTWLQRGKAKVEHGLFVVHWALHAWKSWSWKKLVLEWLVWVQGVTMGRE